MPDALPPPESPSINSHADTTRSILQPEESALAKEAEARAARAFDALSHAERYPDKPLDTLEEVRAEVGRLLRTGNPELWCSRRGDQDMVFRALAAGHDPADIAKAVDQASLHAIAKPEPLYGEQVTSEVMRGIEHSEPMQELINDVTRRKIDLNMVDERRLDKLDLETRIEPKQTLNPPKPPVTPNQPLQTPNLSRAPVTPKTIEPTFGRGGGGGFPVMDIKEINPRDDFEHMLE